MAWTLWFSTICTHTDIPNLPEQGVVRALGQGAHDGRPVRRGEHDPAPHEEPRVPAEVLHVDVRADHAGGADRDHRDGIEQQRRADAGADARAVMSGRARACGGGRRPVRSRLRLCVLCEAFVVVVFV